jgi:NAD(P)-dependent dehydrogenase (short-subunit alcohol dehydrogenase family)
MRFQDKTVFITGAGAGIGRATALAFAAEGAHVVGYDISAAAGEGTAELVRAAGAEALALSGDVADSEDVQRAVGEAVKRFGTLDVLFNNAGIAVRNRVTEQEEADWDEIMRINLRGVFVCSKYVIPHLRRPGGSVVNTSSVAGLVGMRNRSAYGTSKGAIITLGKNMALDYAGEGIRVNTVCPGFVRTGLTEGLLGDAERAKAITAMHPLGRLADAEDIARAVLFLASDDARMITGQVLAVDGGLAVGRPEDI